MAVFNTGKKKTERKHARIIMRVGSLIFRYSPPPLRWLFIGWECTKLFSVSLKPRCRLRYLDDSCQEVPTKIPASEYEFLQSTLQEIADIIEGAKKWDPPVLGRVRRSPELEGRMLPTGRAATHKRFVERQPALRWGSPRRIIASVVRRKKRFLRTHSTKARNR